MIRAHIILYFGDGGGKPGTIITFFPWANADQGRIGDGQVGITSYVVPVGSLDFWVNRLAKFNIAFKKAERFGETSIYNSMTHMAYISKLLNVQQVNKTIGHLAK